MAGTSLVYFMDQGNRVAVIYADAVGSLQKIFVPEPVPELFYRGCLRGILGSGLSR
jgi:hypothetical protein